MSTNPEIVTTSKEERKTMQAAVISEPGNVEMQSVAIPEPDADEVRIQLEGCGLCASDLPVWEGREWFSYPVEAGNPGHEAWGTIDAVGKEVNTLQPGDRVTALCYNAYAEFDTAKESQVVTLPESLRSRPFPGEPLGCAMNIFRRSEIEGGDTVAIIGIGWIGSLLVQLVKSAGATVIGLSRRESSLQQAKRIGADYVWSLDDEDIIDKVKDVTEGNFCDCVIEAAGKQESLNLSGKLAGIRGRLVIAGYHQEGNREVDMQLWNWRGLDVINAHEREPDRYIRGMREAVQNVRRGNIDPSQLITHMFAYENIQKAFEMQQQKPEGFTKALITFDQ